MYLQGLLGALGLNTTLLPLNAFNLLYLGLQGSTWILPQPLEMVLKGYISGSLHEQH